ncbi:Tungstate uptake system permease protein TupB [Tepidimonas sediminis]|uniref:Tungstate uptake system permease protein TupB n=2 Tax=Tepidimonas sediminis TaxID=2588941 RepID=A0A554WM09_9BURK|nr:Tungstate uptake system permease protein TupB [Tepidimonas sediminis]
MPTFAQAWALVHGGDALLWSTVTRSIAVSGSATALACLLGLPLGAWLGVVRFAGRGALVTLLDGLLAVPSVVVGLLVYLLLSRSGPLGFLGWLFSFPAMVLAQTLLVLPVVVNLARRAVEQAERDHGEQLQVLGAGAGWRALLLAWDERHVLLSAALLAFSRAVAEVGAVMVVGGNIEGYTRVMTTAIALETSKGDLPLALALGLVLLLVVVGLHALAALALRWARGGVRPWPQREPA